MESLKNLLSHRGEKVKKEEFKSSEYSYAIKYTWKIPNFSTIKRDYLNSDYFAGGAHEWWLQIHPNGVNKDGCLSIYLLAGNWEVLPSGWSRDVKYNLSVISEIDEHTVEYESEHIFAGRSVCRGNPSFMTLDNLRDTDRRFLVRDTITVRAEVWYNHEEQEKEKLMRKEVDETNHQRKASPSCFDEFDTLFTDINSCLQETTKSSSFSDEEIGDAQTICKQCLSMDVSSFILSGKTHELKSALSRLLTAKAFPDSVIDETTEFLNNFDQRCEKYESAKRDMSEAREDEDSVGELKTALKQLSSKSIPVRDEAEAIDSEISRLEELLDEMKNKRTRLGKKLTEFTQEATTSKQALLCAEAGMNMSALKKEDADKTVNEFQISWDSLKDQLSLMNRAADWEVI